MDPALNFNRSITRRHFFGRAAEGIGAAALANLPDPSLLAAAPGKGPDFPAKAKRVIYLFQNGAPSHGDLFDYKPLLQRWHGRQIPDEVVGGRRFNTMTSGQTDRPVLQEIASFAQHAESGTYVSRLLPCIAGIVDDCCFVKSMVADAVNRAPAIPFLLTGSEMAGRPDMGAWLNYGLGSETENLPAFVVMTSRDKEASCGQIFYCICWRSGFPPSRLQGICFSGLGDPVPFLSNPDGMSRGVRRGILDDMAALNTRNLEAYDDPEIAARIAQYETAYRMQASEPELKDISREPQHVLDLYGPDMARQGSYAYNCLFARRLAEQGVRYMQVMHAGWDQHRNLNTQLEIQCRDPDAPSTGLVTDLKQRGLLEHTLVIWGGDHHPYAFTIRMAGGGTKPGFSYGASDEFGLNAMRNRVHVHDFQATRLHLLGLDHERLTFNHQGRRYGLSDVHGHLVKRILA